MAERRARHLEPLLQLADRQTVSAGADEDADDREPRLRAQSREGLGRLDGVELEEVEIGRAWREGRF